MKPSRLAATGLLLALLGGVGWVTGAQEAVLDFSVSPDPVEIEAGKTATIRITMANRSAHEADDVEFFWLENDVGIGGEPVEPLEVIDAFDTQAVILPVAVAQDTPLGATSAQLEAVYTYCIDIQCYQIVESLTVNVTVVEPAITSAGETQHAQTESVEIGPVVGAVSDSGPAWPLYGGIALAVVLGILLVLAARGWISRLLAGCGICVVIAVGLGVGVDLLQHEQAQSIGAVLCTSCVGIEESVKPVAEWSDDATARIEAVDRPIELVVFSAPWCHSCPYAKAMVAAAAEINGRIGYRIIDVDEEPAEAEAYGVVRSGRTIVPAVVRLDTEEVLFGIEAFESRFIALLEEHE